LKAASESAKAVGVSARDLTALILTRVERFVKQTIKVRDGVERLVEKGGNRHDFYEK
jgi:hypothetical protein